MRANDMADQHNIGRGRDARRQLGQRGGLAQVTPVSYHFQLTCRSEDGLASIAVSLVHDDEVFACISDSCD